MSTKFAEQIIDGMVDENGRCGERGLSRKQFEILSECLCATDWRETGGFWEGNYATICFSERDFEGNIGKYHVVLNQYAHFNDRFSVVSIEPRPANEVEAERKLEQILKFEGSTYMYEPKQRKEMTLTLVRDYTYYGASYSRYDSGERHIYTFADDCGNCYVWKTANEIGIWAEDENGREDWIGAEIGSRVTMKATVKEHSEYRGIKQTVLTRANVLAIS